MEEEKKIDEYILKISSAGINIPHELEISSGYKISARIDITDTNLKDNHNGTYNLIHSGKCNGEIDIETKLGNIIKATAKSKWSDKLHGALWYEAGNRGKETNEYYNALMYFIIKNIHSICELYEKSITPPKTNFIENKETSSEREGQRIISTLARDCKTQGRK